jgi:protein tyrosine phosphatase (PTP) superfamily phosphohydrolase (DUF442 family)
MGDVGNSQRKTVGCSKVCRRRALFPIAVCLGLATAGAFGQGPAAQAPAATMAAQEAQSPAPPLLLNERHPLPGMLTGGSLAGKDKAPDFQAMAAAGVRTYIDLRTDAEVLPDTALLAAGAGLDYRRLPISGEAELDLASVRALDLLLDEWSRYPVAVACSSGNRAGALLALRAFWLDGVDAASALELGLGAGLTRLEPSVRQLLGLPPMPGASPISPPASTGAPSPAVDAATRMPQKPN